jgi:hypothetical protein
VPGDAPEGVLPPLAEEDDASQAPLVVVQFPNEELGVQLARWMVVRALDGLRYMARLSARLAGPGEPPVPLVVNISYGSVIGGHDGTALLESAMDELIAAHGEMAVVLAAGNLYGRQRDREHAALCDRLPSGRHAQAHLRADGGTARLGLYLPPDKSIESHLEIWLARSKNGERAEDPFLQSGEIAVKLIPPAGTGLPSVDAGCPDLQLSPGYPPIYALFVLPRAAQSTEQSLVSLTVAATRISDNPLDGRPAPSGLWTLEIVNKGEHELALDAWVERDILPGKARRQQAARLVELEQAGVKTLNDKNTFNNIATGKLTFRAGAIEAQLDERGRYRISRYSSAAANLSKGPEFSAVADTSAVLPGIRVSGSTGGSTVRVNGTSLAAPQAARWIANQLADGASMATVRARISQYRSPDGDRRGKEHV